ncbi:hypothetical protein [Sphingobium yanoikuyae]|uniref:hypothetical protein n=1 Tax=Sphingobium yanoikuyae TaxID=13690 RepID=UPI001917A259|nr:hypothetical protein [Sphingobium yanoikuyae]
MKIRIDTSDLFRKIPGIIADAEQTARDVRDKIAADIFADVVRETPVDTGQARQGWQLDLIGEQQHIQNSVPYISRLNDGHSQQAPAGFIEAAVDRHTRF